MGGCVSTSTQSSDGDAGSSSCQGSKFQEQGRKKTTNLNQMIDLRHLASVPNRIFSNGKSRSSCVFTQQGQKGINQDAMIVWEVSKNNFISIVFFQDQSQSTCLCISSTLMFRISYRMM